MPAAELLIKTFLEKAIAQGSRSTTLQPLGWLALLLLAATLLSYTVNAPYWLGLTLCIFNGVVILSYLGSYFYFMLKDPDALRSERYSIQKLAIEKGVYGDSTTGVVDLTDVVNQKQLSVQDSSNDTDTEPNP